MDNLLIQWSRIRFGILVLGLYRAKFEEACDDDDDQLVLIIRQDCVYRKFFHLDFDQLTVCGLPETPLFGLSVRT